MCVKAPLSVLALLAFSVGPVTAQAVRPSGLRHPRPLEAKVAAKLPKDCVYSARNMQFFVGEPKCMRLFETKRLRGVWVFGFETSIFVPNALRSPNDAELFRSGIWLETDGSNDPKARAVMRNDGNGHFLVDMIAYAPPIEGVFGSGGASYRGVLLKRFISIRRLP